MAPPADAGVPPLAGRSGPLEEGPPDSAFQADGANHGRRDGGAGFQGLRWHYEALVEDVAANEGDRVPLPRYAGEESSAAAPDSVAGSASAPKDGGGGGGGGHRREERKSGVDVGKSCSKAEQERHKGIPWTEKEHRLFLLGLDKFGKGDWLGLEGSDLRASNQSNQQLRGESLFLFTSLLGSTQIKNPNLGELPAHSSTKYISDKNAPRKQEYLVCSFVGTKKCI